MNLDRRAAVTLIAAGAVMPAPLVASSSKPAKDLVATYSAAWVRMDLDAIVACMVADVRFVGPNVKADGRDAYRASTERFLRLVERVDVRARLRHGNRAMFAYDFVCRDPIGISRVAELVHIANGRIRSSEIFFDTAPFAAFSRAQHS